MPPPYKTPMTWKSDRGSKRHILVSTGGTGRAKPYEQFLLMACGRKFVLGVEGKRVEATCKQCLLQKARKENLRGPFR